MKDDEPYTPRKAAVIASKTGLSVVPPMEDGTKRPLTAWKQFQDRVPDRETLTKWYGTSTGIGVVCGPVSRNLEVLDFDDHDSFILFRDTAESAGLSDLIERIESGYAEVTPSGGVHWLYYCDAVEGNTKLASRPHPTPNNAHGVDVLIETRGTGGYVVLAPSNGNVHDSGGAYRLTSGSLSTIATITADERQELFRVARAMDELPRAEPVGAQSDTDRERTGKRVGDTFNEKTDWPAILKPYGWTRIFQHGDVDYWRRPGKDRGISATTNYGGSDLLYVFTTSTSLESGRSYDRFGVRVFLDYGGDFGAATKALAAEGYGEPLPQLLTSGTSMNGHNPGEVTAAKLRYLRQSDMGNAQRFALRFGPVVRYCFPWKKWLVWSGTHWRSDRHGTIMEFAKETARKIYEEVALETDPEMLDKAKKWAHSSQTNTHLEAMVKLARSEPGIPILPEDLDADPYLFNVLNGTINLRTGNLASHNQTDLITKIAPVEFQEFASLNLWETFLDSVTNGDRDVQDFLQRAAGYSLTGDTREEKLFFVHGPTNSGKSTFAEAVKMVLGEYGMTADFETFLSRTFTGGPRPDIARLAGARLVASIEVDEGKRLAEGLVKMLSGGDTVTARRLYQEEFEFKPTFKLWLVANHAPTIADDDDAMWRRIVRVPFDHTIPVGQRDATIKERLTNPGIAGPAILGWLLEGCLKWQRHGLAIPGEIMRATEQYRSDMDPISGFIDELCVLDPACWTSTKMLRSAYEEWGKEEGRNSKDLLSGKEFGMRLTARGCSPKLAWYQGKRMRGWVGIRLEGADFQEVTEH